MRRLALLLAACAAITGCDKAEDGFASQVGAYSLFDPVAANPSLCGGAAIPFPNNALFSGFADPTLNIPNPSGAPFVTAANLTDGFSTSASIFTDVLGNIDYASAEDSILIFEAGAPPRFLVHGTDYELQPSIAMAQVSGTGHSAGTCTGVLPARFLPISQQRSRILIEPLKPLKPSTTYIVAVTRALKSVDGVTTTPNEFFPIVNSDAKICKLGTAPPDNTGSELLCTDPLAPAEAAARLNAPVLTTLSAAPTTPAQKLATLETLRRALIRPAMKKLKDEHQALRGTALNDSDLVIAWSFTTQSVGKSLSNINTTPFAVPRALGVAATNLNTNQANTALASHANIYAGTVSLPYFLNKGGDEAVGSPPAILNTFWAADATAPDTGASFLGEVACSRFAAGETFNGVVLGPSASTTICYPRPTLKSDQTVPLMVTVPNASAPNAGGACGGRGTLAGSFASDTCVAPVGGWPVVIFQHGITRNRSDMLALAPTLAAAGFVVVAIDLPLHGLVPTASAVTPGCGASATNGFFADGAERTFGVDYVNNVTGASGADGLVDCSGTHFVNLSSLITSRDNLRQAASDIIHLARSVNGLDFDGNPGTDEINEASLHFVGQSLGAIVGTVVMGTDTGTDPNVVDNETFKAASLHVPGGGLGKLLDASASFGPRIAAGLAGNFVFEGTDTYETFVRFAQHLVDPGDPINYAAAANANHALHVVKVTNDAVVPNNANSTCPAASALPLGLGATATALTAPATAAASGAAGAALVALCPPRVQAASPPLAAFPYQDETVIGGFLSGTEPLAAIMNLRSTVTMGPVPFAAQANPGADALVVFAAGTAEHGTLLTPDASAVAGPDATYAAATCAMQKQTATFLASNGALLPIGGTCP